MSRPAAIPPELSSAPFRGTDAVRRGLLTPARLRSRAWVRLMRDVYVHESLQSRPEVRLAALQLVGDRTAIICGLTAAWVYGAWSPAPGLVVPLQVTRPVRAPGTPVTGFSRRRLTLRGTADLVRPPTGLSELDEDVVELGSLRVTSPTRTCFDLMRERWLVEAVAVADAFAYADLVWLALLGAYCEDRRRWPGIRLTRVAVELASAAARSPGETRLRMALVLAGLSEPLVNVPVRDLSGREVAIPDLTILNPRTTAVEYDGGYHDEPEQVKADRRRLTRFVASTEIPLLRYDATDLREPDKIVRSVAAKCGQVPRYPLESQDFDRRLRLWAA